MTLINTRPAVVAFLVDKNGTNQTGVASQTDTPITWSTERFDVGSAFASNAWTPPAGKIYLYAAMSATGSITTNSVGSIGIRKNGAGFAYVLKAATLNAYSAWIAIEDIANGSDYYDVSVWLTLSTGTITISGTTYQTYFTGYRYAL